MKLNCKAGDLAVIVRSMAGNEGRIVRCVEFVGCGDDWHDDCWLVDPPVMGTLRLQREVSDSKLRPLRDNDGEDEVLRIVGKPQPNEVSA